jgi:hypothetical protein
MSKSRISEKEKNLTSLLFGHLEADELIAATRADEDGVSNTFEAGTVRNNDASGASEDDADDEEKNDENDKVDEEDKAVWHDSDDDEGRVNVTSTARRRKLRKDADESTLPSNEYADRLRERFVQMQTQNVAWAELPDRKRKREIGDADGDENAAETDEADDDVIDKRRERPVFDVARTTARLVGRQGKITLTRLKDANIREPSKAVVQVRYEQCRRERRLSFI